MHQRLAALPVRFVGLRHGAHDLFNPQHNIGKGKLLFASEVGRKGCNLALGHKEPQDTGQSLVSGDQALVLTQGSSPRNIACCIHRNHLSINGLKSGISPRLAGFLDSEPNRLWLC